MNAPTHFACAAFLAQAIATSPYLRSNFLDSSWKVSALAALCAAVGIASHLLLDLLPHYAWIVHLNCFRWVPYDWLFREAFFGFAVAIPLVYLGRKNRQCVVAAMCGGIYPDVEKIFYLGLDIPERFVLFGWHSKYLSSRTWGLPYSFLIAFEICLIFGFLLGMHWLAERGKLCNKKT